MKRAFSFMMILLLGRGAFAQSDDKPAPSLSPNFAIVTLADMGAHFECVLKYSDGKVFSLENTLNMKVKDGHLVNQDDFDAAEFKVLDYLNKMGFEPINVMHENRVDDYFVAKEKYYAHRLYFKRKGS